MKKQELINKYQKQINAWNERMNNPEMPIGNALQLGRRIEVLKIFILDLQSLESNKPTKKLEDAFRSFIRGNHLSKKWDEFYKEWSDHFNSKEPDKLIEHSNNTKLLERYSYFLEENGYTDVDWRTEEPFAIDEFLKIDRQNDKES
jgi:hypothetical protein